MAFDDIAAKNNGFSSGVGDVGQGRKDQNWKSPRTLGITAASVIAVAVLGQRKIDAVVTDVDMPGGLSGLDLAKMISTTHMNVPVIIASGRHRLRREELPGDAVFVPKPYGLDVIAAMVGNMTAGEGRRLAG